MLREERMPLQTMRRLVKGLGVERLLGAVAQEFRVKRLRWNVSSFWQVSLSGALWELMKKREKWDCQGYRFHSGGRHCSYVSP